MIRRKTYFKQSGGEDEQPNRAGLAPGSKVVVEVARVLRPDNVRHLGDHVEVELAQPSLGSYPYGVARVERVQRIFVGSHSSHLRPKDVYKADVGLAKQVVLST